MHKKKILITGALGQDGLILSNILLKKNYNVFGIIKNKKYKRQNSKIRYKKLDLKKKEDLFNYIKKIKPETIVHFGSNNPSYIEKIKSNKFYNENVYFTKSLIQAFVNNNLKVHFIFANSSQIFSKKKNKVNEKSKFIISTKYNKFRINILKFLNKFKDDKNFSYTNLILFNHDSKLRNEKFLFPRLIKAIKNKDINFVNKIYNQNIIADFSHAEDICYAIYLLIKKNICIENLILSSGKKTKVNNLIDQLILKYKLKFKFSSKIKNNKNYLIGNNNLAKKLLKWRPKKNIFDALTEMYE